MSNTEKEVLKQDTPVQDEMLDKIQDSANQEEVQVDQSNESLDQAIEEAEDQVSQLEAEKEALSDQLLRLQAEIQNMRRINQRERQDAAKYRSQSLASYLLDVADNLERALATPAESEDAKAIHKGIEMVYKQFQQAFEKEGISVIDPLNQAFDPNFHQAVSMMPAGEDQEADTVINVLQKGYMLQDRVLRPAMVIVAQ
ncbi:nucleotide exchange factor GrpE [uncultured Abiotrophia sp.]|uniref:nucleotide exchange factor GrpE n=1 Tax=uncultured Abiotrophia sp. TaxID=316094 RepID=UPI0028D14AA4|nr:nucleotide exchange factor GrpE [uncultured Abiotrophia sp.]